MEGEQKDGVERLRERLYSRNARSRGKRAPRRLHREAYDLKTTWKEPAANETGEWPRGFTFAAQGSTAKSSSRFLTWLLAGAVLFFLGAALVSAYLFFGNMRVISPGNVGINVTGPTTVPAGEEVPIQITITNTNTTTLELTDLVMSFPDGTRASTAATTPLSRSRESLGSIAPGESVQRTVRVVFLGEEGSRKDIKVTLEYRIEGSNAIFFKDQPYELAIGSSPVAVVVQSVKEATAGQGLDLSAEVTSNSNTLIQNVLLSALYPPGFTFKSATPEPTFDKNVWRIGDLPPRAKRTITIHGSLEGENNSERVFRVVAGIQNPDNEKEVGVSLVAVTASVTIKRPFLGATLSVNGESSLPVHALGSGQPGRIIIAWANNLPVAVRDVEIRATISGAALDKSGVSVSNGFYRSADNVVLWDQRTNPELALLRPGDQGQVNFVLSSLTLATGEIVSFRNPEIGISVDLQGQRLSENNVPEKILSTVATKLDIISDLTLFSRLSYFSGPFKNTGPLPMKVEKETTFTVTWSINNTTNDITGTTVAAKLPPYARLVGLKKPSDELLSLNPLTGEVVWNVGDIKAGVGYTAPAREVSFQIGLTPSANQVNTVPNIIGDAKISGTDRFTGTPVENISRAASLGSDRGFKNGDDQVVK